MKHLRTLASLSALALLAACSGGSHGLTPSTSTSPSQPNAPLSGQKTTATMRVTIPNHTNVASLKPKYLTPQVRGVEFIVTQNGSQAGYVFYPVDASQAYCSQGTSGLTCNLAVQALPGNDTITVNTYDQGNPSITGTNGGNANRISSGTISATISATSQNTINVVTAGVPTFVSVATDTSAIALAGKSIGLLRVNVLDADFNYIVGAYSQPVTFSAQIGNTVTPAVTMPGPVTDSSQLAGLTYSYDGSITANTIVYLYGKGFTGNSAPRYMPGIGYPLLVGYTTLNLGPSALVFSSPDAPAQQSAINPSNGLVGPYGIDSNSASKCAVATFNVSGSSVTATPRKTGYCRVFVTFAQNQNFTTPAYYGALDVFVGPAQTLVSTPGTMPAIGFLSQTTANSVGGNIGGTTSLATLAVVSAAEDPVAGTNPTFATNNLTITAGSVNTASAYRSVQSIFGRGASYPVMQHRGSFDRPEDPAIRATVERIRNTSVRVAAGSLRRTRSSTVPASLTVGSTTANIWVQKANIGSSSSTMLQVPATLEAQTAHGNIWIDNTLLSGANASASFSTGSVSATANRIGVDFENAYGSNTQHFATPHYAATAPGMSFADNACDSNGNATGSKAPDFVPEPADGRTNVMVLNTAALGNGVGGYFSPINYYSQQVMNCYNTGGAQNYMSNEAPFIYVGWFENSGASYELQEDLVRGQAHEFQHLINFVSHFMNNPSSPVASEDPFINEGLSMLAQDYAVSRMFGAQGVTVDLDDAVAYHAATYLANPQNYSVSEFIGMDPNSQTATYNCGGGCYGAAYLTQRYFADRCGGDAYTHAMETAGFVHGLNIVNACRTTEAFGQLMGDFAVAMAASSNGITSTDSRFRFGSLNLRGTYYDQFVAKYTLAGVNAMQLGANQSFSGQLPLGGIGFVQVSGIPNTGLPVSIVDGGPGANFGLLGGLVQK